MRKYLCLGDTALDESVLGSVTRINPDAPGMVFVPDDRIVTRGMLGNVVANLQLLDLNCYISVYHQRSEIRKLRYVDRASGYILPIRVDTGDNLPSNDKANIDGFIKSLAGVKLGDFSACLFIDYGKGFLSKEFIKQVAEMCQAAKVPTFIDTKYDLGEWSKSISVAKINQKEYDKMFTKIANPSHYVGHLIVTLGDKGCHLYEKDKVTYFPTQKVPVVNLVGAGDTFLATLAIACAKNVPFNVGIDYANKAASIKVSRQGIASVKDIDVW